MLGSSPDADIWVPQKRCGPWTVHASQRHMDSSSTHFCALPPSHHQSPPPTCVPPSLKPHSTGHSLGLSSFQAAQLGYFLQHLSSQHCHTTGGMSDLVLPCFHPPAAHSSGYLGVEGWGRPDTSSVSLSWMRRNLVPPFWILGINYFFFLGAPLKIPRLAKSYSTTCYT